jgi:hypothetical protein
MKAFKYTATEEAGEWVVRTPGGFVVFTGEQHIAVRWAGTMNRRLRLKAS